MLRPHDFHYSMKGGFRFLGQTQNATNTCEGYFHVPANVITESKESLPVPRWCWRFVHYYLAAAPGKSLVLPALSTASSAGESDFVMYLLPNTGTSCSKNLHSCFSPLQAQFQSLLWATWGEQEVKAQHNRTALVAPPTSSPRGTAGSWPSASWSGSGIDREFACTPGWLAPQRSECTPVCWRWSPSDCPGHSGCTIFPGGPRSRCHSRSAWHSRASTVPLGRLKEKSSQHSGVVLKAV